MIRDPFLFDLVQQELIDKYGINTVRNGGLKAYTTIDPELQERAQEAVDSCGVCYPEGGPAAALASVDPGNGRDRRPRLDRRLRERKPVQLRLAGAPPARLLVQDLRPRRPRSSRASTPTAPTTTAPRRRRWRSPAAVPTGTVNNAEPGGGTMSLASATWHSVNVIFAQLDLDVGPENVTQTARGNGDHLAAGIGPGRGDRRPRRRRHAAGDGRRLRDPRQRRHPPRRRRRSSRVEFPDGKVDETDPESGERVLTEGEAYEVTTHPRGRDHPGHRRRLHLHGVLARRRARPVPRRTLSDAWFAGYTPLYSTAVWVGHPQSREATGYGGPTAGPIWRSFMESAVAGNCPEFRRSRQPARALRSRQRAHLVRRLLGRIRVRRRRTDRQKSKKTRVRSRARPGSCSRAGPRRARFGTGPRTGPRAALGRRGHRQSALSA